MKDKFLDQKEILTSLKHEISLLHQQIDYLLRNGRALGLLDLDVMMNRTHTIYDQLCSISLGEDEATGEEEVAPEMLNALFGSLSGDESDTDPVANTEPEKEAEEEPMEEPEEEQEPAEVPTPAEESIVEEPTEEPMEEPMEEPTEEPMEEPEEEEKTEEISFDFNLTAEDPEVVETVSDEEPSLWFDQPEPAEENEEVIPEEPVEEPEEPVEELEKPEEISFDFNFTAEDPEVVEATPDEEPAAEKEETDYGFIFKMEPIPEPEEAPAQKPAQTYTTGDQIELEIPHFDFPESDEPVEDSDTEEEPLTEEDFPEEEPFAEENFPEEEPLTEEDFHEEEPLTEEDFHEEEPLTEEDFPKEEGTEEEFIEDEASQEEESNEEEESVEEEVSAEEEESNEAEPVVEKEPGDDFPYEPVVFGDMEEKDDLGFEFETHETIGEKLHVKTLKSAIGINDKFLLVNELFGGNMGKYERSMDNLDDLKTLNGALIYMNELRVELQWNSNNEAYKKLLELVHRKFED